MPNEESAHADEHTLSTFLVSRARSASDIRLAGDAGGGLIAAVAIALLRPPLWPVLLAIAITFAAYGTWAILDRELTGEDVARAAARRRLLETSRAVTAVLGVAAAVVGGLLLFFLVLGDSWMS
jgi:hypothetical protein